MMVSAIASGYSVLRKLSSYPLSAAFRSGVSSESDPDDVPISSSEIDSRLYRFSASKSTGRVTSEESEDDATDDSRKLDCHYATRRPHPQAVSDRPRPNLLFFFVLCGFDEKYLANVKSGAIGEWNVIFVKL